MHETKPRKCAVSKKRIEGIANLIACLALVVLFVGILTIINLDVWFNPIFWLILGVLLLGIGVWLWSPIVIEPFELLPEEEPSPEALEYTLMRGSASLSNDQKADQFRIVQQGQKTLSEELVRPIEERES